MTEGTKTLTLDGALWYFYMVCDFDLDEINYLVFLKKKELQHKRNLLLIALSDIPSITEGHVSVETFSKFFFDPGKTKVAKN